MTILDSCLLFWVYPVLNVTVTQGHQY